MLTKRARRGILVLMKRIGISGVNGAVLDRVLRGEIIQVEQYRRPVAIIVRRPITLSEADELAARLRDLVKEKATE